ADDDAHAVVDKELAADDGGRMDFDAGHEAAELRQQAGKKVPFALPQGMRGAMQNDRMEALIEQSDLKAVARGGVAFHDAGNFFANMLEHLPLPSVLCRNCSGVHQGPTRSLDTDICISGVPSRTPRAARRQHLPGTECKWRTFKRNFRNQPMNFRNNNTNA